MGLPQALTKIITEQKDLPHLLAVSGGLDSMALLHIYCHFREHFNLSFRVAHVHHGPSENQFLEDYRFNAYAFVKQQCEKLNVDFVSNWSDEEQKSLSEPFDKELSSEGELRDFRYGQLENWLSDGELLVLAHHRDDLLETRLIRLLRGVGPEGLQSMQVLSGNRFRPLLDVSRQELKEYLLDRSGACLNDPSNEDFAPLRNWIRKKWLKDLEVQRPGAVGNLARSLDLLVNFIQDNETFSQCFTGDELIISEFLALNLAQKRQVLATYMRGQNLKNYGLSHISEVIKRLDTERKQLTFQLLGRSWTVDAGRMSVEGPGRIET